ncbi:peptide-methionine (R)-S-oxide reductase MsrB [Flavihumibacter stibioxidans]|nr:peptide-methionine (R)-S-oxide reductase MsrB [Flavihumibacter stibioxidans]
MKVQLVLISCLVFFQQCSFSQPGPKKEQQGVPKTSSNTTNTTNNMDSSKQNPVYSRSSSEKVNLSEEEWKKILPQEVYYIARQKGTERPWTSRFEDFKEIGTYYCAACGNPLFKSDTKFDSGCGWPSFYEPISKGSIIYSPDNTHGMKRTEVMCGRCKSHLGHVFEDGPPPTGLRYCINGVVLDFDKKKEK